MDKKEYRKQYYLLNKDKIRNKQKIYDEKNKEKISEYRKKYRKENLKTLNYKKRLYLKEYKLKNKLIISQTRQIRENYRYATDSMYRTKKRGCSFYLSSLFFLFYAIQFIPS